MDDAVNRVLRHNRDTETGHFEKCRDRSFKSLRGQQGQGTLEDVMESHGNPITVVVSYPSSRTHTHTHIHTRQGRKLFAHNSQATQRCESPEKR